MDIQALSLHYNVAWSENKDVLFWQERRPVLKALGVSVGLFVDFSVSPSCANSQEIDGEFGDCTIQYKELPPSTTKAPQYSCIPVQIAMRIAKCSLSCH